MYMQVTGELANERKGFIFIIFNEYDFSTRIINLNEFRNIEIWLPLI